MSSRAPVVSSRFGSATDRGPEGCSRLSRRRRRADAGEAGSGPVKPAYNRVALPSIRNPLRRAPSHVRPSDALKRDLRAALDGEVRFDAASRALYSTDASVYQIEPLGVVLPRSLDDVVRTVEVAATTRRADHAARRRHVAGRAGHRRRPRRRHVEVPEPHPGHRSRPARTARVAAGRRARRAERGAQAARPALRARRVHGQPRHRRRHDRQQLQRRAVGRLRQDHRPRARAPGRAVRRRASTHARDRVTAAERDAARQGDGVAAPCLSRRSRRSRRRTRRRSTDASRRSSAASAATTSTRSWIPARPWTSSRLIVGSEGTLAFVLEATLGLVPLPKAKALLTAEFDHLLDALGATPRRSCGTAPPPSR